MNNQVGRIKSHKEAENYIASLRDGAPGRKEEAKKALISSGVLNKNGYRKRKIVSWE